jgi:DNA-binding winged helix-turn-helix (wHTH) protein/tetratricopeptide (TPR) repeat protein
MRSGAATGAEVYAFADWVFDAAERRLSHSGTQVALTPKAYALLLALIRRAGRLVTKRELLDEVWPETFVEEGVLAVHMSVLRKTLGERRGEQRYIETVSRAGYRFTATVVHGASRSHSFSLRWPIGVLPSHYEVSELVARGRAHLLTSSRVEIPRAVTSFEAAIEREPTYAPAHAGVALAYCAQAELRLRPPKEAHEAARVAALRALAMDSLCADAQVALGTVLFLSDWNWTGAERSLARALELDAGHVDAYLLYGRLLDSLGRFDEALAAKHKALEREPSSARLHLQIAHSLWNQRRYEEVIAWATRTLALDPRHMLAREYLAGAYLQKGDIERHVAECVAHAEAFGAPLAAIAELRMLYELQGRAGVLELGIRQGCAGGAPPLALAVHCAEAGRVDEALTHLDRALAERDPCLVDLAVAPQWDPLRGDPRFAVRLAAMGLADVHPLVSFWESVRRA